MSSCPAAALVLFGFLLSVTCKRRTNPFLPKLLLVMVPITATGENQDSNIILNVDWCLLLLLLDLSTDSHRHWGQQLGACANIPPPWFVCKNLSDAEQKNYSIYFHAEIFCYICFIMSLSLPLFIYQPLPFFYFKLYVIVSSSLQFSIY